MLTCTLFRADDWCHAAGHVLEKWAKEEGGGIDENEPGYAKEWRDTLGKELDGVFNREFVQRLKPPKIEKDGLDWEDPVACCHIWLEENKLRPRIVHIERMSKAEYLIMSEKENLASEFGIGASTPTGLSALFKTVTGQQNQRQMASVHPLNLAFVAGYQRAGWLFMPSKTREGRMPPTERRLKMVVDIPKDLLKLGIHIHKIFLTSGMSILPCSAFGAQVKNLGNARSQLDEVEDLYDSNDYSKRIWRLMKSRMRNTLDQGWAEEIVLDIPPVKTN